MVYIRYLYQRDQFQNNHGAFYLYKKLLTKLSLYSLSLPSGYMYMHKYIAHRYVVCFLSNYLNITKVYLMLLEENKEFLEVVFSWEIVTTVWPYSLKKTRKIQLKNE